MKWKAWTFFICMMIICCILGVWQVQRYHFKKHLQDQFNARANAAPVWLQEGLAKTADVQYLKVKVRGFYQNEKTFFLDNRIYQGQMGVEVLTPFVMTSCVADPVRPEERAARLEGLVTPASTLPSRRRFAPPQGERAGKCQQNLVVDRGWVARPSSALPVIPEVTGEQTLAGDLKTYHEYQFILGDNVLSRSPLVMQKVDFRALSALTSTDYYPFVLRLDKNAPSGFVRDWVVTATTPERHLAYAVQWFVFASVLLVACLYIKIKA